MTRKEQINNISSIDAIEICKKILGMKILFTTEDSKIMSYSREYLRTNKITPKQAIDAIQRKNKENS